MGRFSGLGRAGEDHHDFVADGLDQFPRVGLPASFYGLKAGANGRRRLGVAQRLVQASTTAYISKQDHNIGRFGHVAVSSLIPSMGGVHTHYTAGIHLFAARVDTFGQSRDNLRPFSCPDAPKSDPGYVAQLVRARHS
jgi:hypothetical protein